MSTNFFLGKLTNRNPTIRIDLLSPPDGSGFNSLGFFGTGGPGNSLLVNEFNKETWKVNSAGQGPGTNNVGQGKSENWEWIHANSGNFATGSGVNLNDGRLYNAGFAPSGSGSIIIRWNTPETAPQVSGFQIQNAELWAYQTSGTYDAPNGINIFAAEILDSGMMAQGAAPRTNTQWTQLTGSGGPLRLVDRIIASGFPSGLPSGLQKDYVVAVSAKPTSGGTKTWTMLLKFEYL